MQFPLFRAVIYCTLLGLILYSGLILTIPRLFPVHGAADDLAVLLTSMQCAENDSAPDSASIPECWQGIRIGATSRTEAKRLLEAHPWVGAIFESSLALSWHWSGAQPRMIDATYDGLARISGGIVQQIRIQTHARFGDFWVALGIPDSALLVRPVSRSSAYQIVDYPLYGLHIISTLSCPVRVDDFWSAKTTLGMGDIWLTESLNGSRFGLYAQPRWWARLRLCRIG